jgi:hypothetical protein
MYEASRAGRTGSGSSNRDAIETSTVVTATKLDAARESQKGITMTTGRELYGAFGAGEPISFNGEVGYIRVFCTKCNVEYDIREVANETTYPAALHVARFDCPKGHHCEARRVFRR